MPQGKFSRELFCFQENLNRLVHCNKSYRRRWRAPFGGSTPVATATPPVLPRATEQVNAFLRPSISEAGLDDSPRSRWCVVVCIHPLRFHMEVTVGLTNLKVRIANPANTEVWMELAFLVDSGAMYSCVPGKILRDLGIEPHSHREFILANGEVIRRSTGTAAFEYQGLRGDSLVMFGEEGDANLIGVTTLETFGFILDPLRNELKPVPMRM